MADESRIHQLVFFGRGHQQVQVLWRDFLEALQRLSPAQQEICRQHLATGGVVKMVRELESERDAAIAAKEAAEKGCATAIGVQHDMTARFRRMSAVVDAARAFVYAGTDRDVLLGRLEIALRALDAGEAPQTESPKSCPCGRWRDPKGRGIVDAAEAAIETEAENEQLRSALTRAEEAKAEAERKLSWDAETLRQTLDDRDSLRSQLQAEKALSASYQQGVEAGKRVVAEMPALVERTAKAQRARILADVVSWGSGNSDLSLDDVIAESELVTFETLPGENTSDVYPWIWRLGERGMDADYAWDERARIAAEIASWPKYNATRRVRSREPAEPEAEGKPCGPCNGTGKEREEYGGRPCPFCLGTKLDRRVDAVPPKSVMPDPEASDELAEALEDAAHMLDISRAEKHAEPVRAAIARIASDADVIAGLRAQRDALWALLDDIDTLDDAARDDDRVFRDEARRKQRKRFSIWNPEVGAK